MNGLAIVVLLIGGLWLGVLTLVVLLLVRQIGLLTVAVQTSPIGHRVDIDADGPKIGSRVPDAVTSMLPQITQGRVHILRVSASCLACRELMTELPKQRMAGSVVVLTTGRGELADSFAALLLPGMRLIRDPEANVITDALQIHSSPFALTIESGDVVSKRYVRSAADFARMVESQQSAGVYPRLQMEVHHVN